MKPNKPPRKPVRTVRCPACNYGTFTVIPFVVPELLYEFLDNGDRVVTLEDFMTDERDEITCDNCWHEGTWTEFGK